MLFVFLISGLIAGIFLGKTELKNIYQPAMETGTISYRSVVFVSFIFVLTGAVLGGEANSLTLAGFAKIRHIREILFIDVLALIIYFIFDRYKYPVSLVQLLLGGVIGWLVYSNQIHQDYFFITKLVSAWIISPFVAFLLAYLFYVLLRKFFLSSKIHLLKTETIIRALFIVACLLFAYAIGANNVAITTGVFQKYFPQMLVFGNYEIKMIYFLLLIGGISTVSGLFLIRNKRLPDKESLTTDVSSTALFSAALLMVVFSYIPLIYAPLSATQLVSASFMGIAFAKGNKKPEWVQIRKTACSIIILPLISALLVFIIMGVFYSFMGSKGDENWVYLPDKILNYEFPLRLNFVLALAVILLSLFITAYTIYLYFNNKKKADEKENRWKEQFQFSEYQKALTEIEKNTVQLENTNLASQLDNKQKELITYSINIGEQKQYLDSIYKSLQKAIKTDDADEKNAILNEELITLKQKMSYSGELENIYKQAEEVHISFMEKLNAEYPDLSAQEKRLMMLLRIGLSSKEIAPLLNISIKSVEISRYRLRKKLNIQKNTNLIQFTKNL